MRYLKIQNFLRDILLFTLQDNLKIDFAIKFDAFKYIILDFNNIAILRFCSIKIAQQVFCYLFLYLKYCEYCFKYIANSCILSLNQIN